MSKWIALAIACAPVASAQDARKIVEESQKRNQSKSQRYEGTLEVVNAKSRVTTKQWEFIRLGSFRQFQEPAALHRTA
jgi:hypothetical protein